MTDGPPPRHLHPVHHDEEPPPYDDEAYNQPPPPPDDQPTRDTKNDAPADRGAERALLATLIRNPDNGTDITALLDPTDLYWPLHRDLWDAWTTTHQADGIPPDATTLNTRLLATKNVELVRTLADILTADGSIVRAPVYAKSIRNEARRRQIIDTGTKLLQIGRSTSTDLDVALDHAVQTTADAAMRFGPTVSGPANTGLTDMSWVLEGKLPPNPPPVYGRRTDDTALFYVGRVNGLFGDPSAAKTWLAMVAGVEALQAGQCFAFVDVDHNGKDHTAGRLLRLGATLTQIADPTRFRYYEPEDADQLRAAVADITALAPAVVVLDSIGEILPMLGVKSIDNDEISSALREIAMPPAKAGSCVITIDHLPKSIEARATGYAIGGTAKKRAMDGAYLRVEAKVKPRPGGIGRMTLRIEKDRTGELERTSGGGYAGTFTLDSTHDVITTWTIGREDSPVDSDGKFRPTGVMEQTSRFIENNDQCGFNQIKDGVTAQDKTIRAAIKLLVEEGFVSVHVGARNASLHHSIALYREAEDDHLQ